MHIAAHCWLHRQSDTCARGHLASGHRNRHSASAPQRRIPRRHLHTSPPQTNPASATSKPPPGQWRRAGRQCRCHSGSGLPGNCPTSAPATSTGGFADSAARVHQPASPRPTPMATRPRRHNHVFLAATSAPIHRTPIQLPPHPHHHRGSCAALTSLPLASTRTGGFADTATPSTQAQTTVRIVWHGSC